MTLPAEAKAKKKLKLLHLPVQLEQRLDSPIQITEAELRPKTWLRAVIQQECGGNYYEIGDLDYTDHAYGPLQVRDTDLVDVNRRFGWHYRAVECLGNLNLSIKIFVASQLIWTTEKRLGRPITNEDICRNWNGGPIGYRKKSTRKYWAGINAKHDKIWNEYVKTETPTLAER